MSFSAAKPLPGIPYFDRASRKPQKRMDLTPNAHDHVRKVIAQCVTDESLPTSWITLVHQAVEDIGKAATDYDWLAGLQATKDFRRRRIVDAQTTINSGIPETNESRETTKDKEKDTLKSTNKQLSPPKATAGTSTPSPRRLRAPKLRGAELQELHSRAMAELQRLSNMSNVMNFSGDPPADSMLHLLITTVFSDDALFLSPPNPPGCQFVRGDFALPPSEGKQTRRQETVIDISGIDSWKCDQ